MYHTSLSLPYSALGTLAKICDKLIKRKIVLKGATQVEARYLYKTNEIKSTSESPINLKFHENAISELAIFLKNK